VISQSLKPIKLIVVSQMKKVERQKPGPKPTGKGEPVMVRILPDLLAAIDQHAKNTGVESRAAVIREIVAGYLKRKGLL
jgi:hypothetical protein